MARLLGLKQVPVFVETGDAKVTTEYGKNIKDYPTTGKTGDHDGLDIVRCTDGKTSSTATICALADGEVIAVRKWVKGFRDKDATGGNCVHIKHADGKVTKYLHLKYGTIPAEIENGAIVKKGQTLGYMGATGLAYGAHLHFQVEDEKGMPINPEPYLTGEIIIGKEKEYFVKIGVFKNKEEAEEVRLALKKLGTDSEIEEK